MKAPAGNVVLSGRALFKPMDVVGLPPAASISKADTSSSGQHHVDGTMVYFAGVRLCSSKSKRSMTEMDAGAVSPCVLIIRNRCASGDTS